jgi:hypothetical protein
VFVPESRAKPSGSDGDRYLSRPRSTQATTPSVGSRTANVNSK